MANRTSGPLSTTDLTPLKDKIRLKIEYVPPELLRPNPTPTRRPASNTQKRKLDKCVSRFGPLPVIVDSTGTIIDGHEVWQAAIRCGYKLIPVIRIEHLSPEEIQLLGIALNRLVGLRVPDEKQLGHIFQDLAISVPDLDLEISGYDMGEIDVFIEGLTAPGDIPEDPGDDPLPPGPAVCRAGDLWQLDRHRVLCANALESTSYEALMQGERANIVVTDPPFNVPIQGHVSGNGAIQHREFAMASGEMNEAEFTAFLTQVCKLLAFYSTMGSIHYIFMDWRHIFEMMTAGRAAYDELKNICVWAKDNGGMGSLYRSRHELVFVFKHGKTPHHNNVQLGKFGRYRTNVWNYPGANSLSRQGGEGNPLALHPTVKPAQMIADAILDCSARGDIVLDPFLGSGTALIAAQRVGRICYGMELDALYVDTALRRWQRECGGHAIHAATGKTFDEIAAERKDSHE